MSDLLIRLDDIASMDLRCGGLPAHTIDTAEEAMREISALRQAHDKALEEAVVLRRALDELLTWVAINHANDGWDSLTTPEPVVDAADALAKLAP